MKPIAFFEIDGCTSCDIVGAPSYEDCLSLNRYFKKYWQAYVEEVFDTGFAAKFRVILPGRYFIMAHDSQSETLFRCQIKILTALFQTFWPIWIVGWDKRNLLAGNIFSPVGDKPAESPCPALVTGFPTLRWGIRLHQVCLTGKEISTSQHSDAGHSASRRLSYRKAMDAAKRREQALQANASMTGGAFRPD